MTRRTIIALATLLLLALPAVAQGAEFGFAPGSATAIALKGAKGGIDRQAGSHPWAYTVHFDLETEGGKSSGGEMRDVIADLPPGLIGNPLAVPRCPRKLFEGGVPQCSPSSQVGVVRAILPGIGEAFGPLYNLVPPPGTAAQLGFSSPAGLTLLQSVTVEPTEEEDRPAYGVRVLAPDLPVEVISATEVIWGVPASPEHTPERGPEPQGGVPSEAPELPFLTLPTSCDTVPQLTLRADSQLSPGTFVKEVVFARDEIGEPAPMTGCEAVPFGPAALTAPSTARAESSTGLGFETKLPNTGLLDSKALAAETEPKKVEVTLPAGVTVNPSAANGLVACSLAQYKAASLSNPGCPEASKVGDLTAKTPLLEEGIEGAVYLAAPRDNPFGSFLGIYIVARMPQLGILIKQAGEVRANPVTGQLTTTVDGLPPVPYSSFKVALREGPRAPLITPQLCGTYETKARFYPYSNPAAPVEKSVPFTVTMAAHGGPCASSEAQLPNSPGLEAGTLVPRAGAYSPFVFRLSRQDGDQRFSSLTATLPKGLSAKLAGVPYCPEAGIAQALARGFEGGGALELAQPSCPAASQVGIVNAGAGAGSSPYYVQGKVYLAGPYKGAPLSMVIITPAVAGPFDLGAIVVRAGLYVDESTAVVTVKSDPLPTILQGVPVDVRSVSVRAERGEFSLNPTNCEVLALTGSSTSIAGSSAPLFEPFQVGGCANLPFAPKISMQLSGGTTRAKHPAFKATLTQPSGQANIKRFSLTLPPTEFVDPNHVANPCTRPQFAAGTCPSASVLGKVKAFTPLLDKPLEGKIYFRANGGERELPDAVADLNGQVHLVSVGFVDALHHKGSEESRIRTTIATVPDAPISKAIIELKGGKKHGLLVNSANICRSENRAIVKFWGQNGKTQNSEPQIAVKCGAKRKK